MKSPAKTRILHVIGSMNRGGAESWLMNVLNTIDRDRYQMDFMVSTSEPGEYDPEIRSLGGRIFHAGSPRNPLKYLLNLRSVLLEEGPFDVVHSHLHHYSGIPLLAARIARVPGRISHSHNDLSHTSGVSTGIRKFYLWGTEILIQWNSTKGLAVSEEAARSLFGANWRQNPKHSILYCGIDTSKFCHSSRGRQLRSELNIPDDRYIVGHVGSFTAQKNHEFIVSLADAFKQLDRNVHFLLIGDGPKRSKIEAMIEERALTSQVTLLGVRRDISEIMMNVFDAFVLPSRHEGLPLVSLEAQAAGLPTLLSDRITRESCVVEELVTFLPIDEIDEWVSAISSLEQCGSFFDRESAKMRVERSPFNIVHSVDKLVQAYNDAAKK